MGSVGVEPFFRPFEGRDYHAPKIFRGRLLVVGESYYLAPRDVRANFTESLMADVITTGGRMAGWKTPYYTNLFYVLTGVTAANTQRDDWAAVSNSIAFYVFVQSSRLTKARMRPSREEWQQAIPSFLCILERLMPDFVLLTGSQLCAHATKIEGAHGGERPGVYLPVGAQRFAYARCIYHPSSPRFMTGRDECRRNFLELIS